MGANAVVMAMGLERWDGISLFRACGFLKNAKLGIIHLIDITLDPTAHPLAC